MKFLCVPCDAPMELIETRGPDRGSMSLVYSCPACGYEFAMMTNPAETQAVGSLGVKLGGAAATAGAAEAESKCPFGSVVQEMAAEAEAAGAVAWTAPARERLEGIPEFVRPMAKTGIEKFARDHGYEEVTAEVLDRARTFFGM